MAADLVFYNPKVSCMNVSISLLKGTLQLQISKALDPGNLSRPKPGEKRYDHDNSLFFSLNMRECTELALNWNAVADGTYNNPKSRDEKYANAITFEHFSDDNKSLVMLTVMKSPNYDKSMIVSIFNSEKQQRLYYPLSGIEVDMFREIVMNCYRRLPFECMLINAKERLVRYQRYEEEQRRKSTMKSGVSNEVASYDPKNMKNIDLDEVFGSLNMGKDASTSNVGGGKVADTTTADDPRKKPTPNQAMDDEFIF